jgi:translation initiation factor 5B
LIKAYGAEVKIPGFLVIDTPGHEAFVNLRRRGGSIADIAILVVDILEGLEEITYECLRILRERKVPFVVALNKVDKVPGWRPREYASFLLSFKEQAPEVRRHVEELTYNVVAQLSYEGFEAERYDRVKDFAKTLAIVPTSALTGEGIPDLLLVLAGLTQRYLLGRLRAASGPARGVVLECREPPGLGPVVDAIVYDGVLKRDDIIVLGGLSGPIVTKVRALMLPKPLDEMRDPEDRFKQVDEVHAAAGVRVVAPKLSEAVAGSPLLAASSEEEVEELKKAVAEEMASIRFSTQAEGVVVKADTLGSLEAMVSKLRSAGVPVRLADVGSISKRDVVEASLVKPVNKQLGVILAFNVKLLPEAEEEIRSRGIPLFSSNVIYRVLDDYKRWLEELREEERRKELRALIWPGKVKLLPGCVFRRSEPAIVGVEVLAGRIRPGYPLMRGDGKRLGVIMQIQDKGRPIEEAQRGLAVAISIRGDVLVGRHVKEGDVLYVDVPEAQVELFLSKYREELSPDELELLRQLSGIRAGSQVGHA